jgi:hypothetical protein
LTQPADAFARDEQIIVEPALRAAADVPSRAEYVKPVRLDRLAVVDCRLGLEDRLVHFELAEVGGLVAEALQDGAHVGQARVEGRRIRIFHLIEDVIDLRRLAGEKRRA